MFFRSNRENEERKAAHGRGQADEPGSPPASVLAADMTLVGDLACGRDCRIDGQVRGDVAGERIVVGTAGQVEGKVTARTLRVEGRITGPISAGTVVLTRAARVAGDITYEQIAIEAGADFSGALKRKPTADRRRGDAVSNVVSLGPVLARSAADRLAASGQRGGDDNPAA